MVGFVIATHGDLAIGFKNALKLIIGSIDNSYFLGLYEGDSVDSFGERILENVELADKGDGVIVFTDLIGASPFNQSVSKLHSLSNENIRVVAGVNLPMLIEAVNSRMLDNDIDNIEKNAVDSGITGIKNLESILNNKYN